ncbi:cbb3-type cytochrome c oxidase subunit I [Parachryseolinea silvisoli]|uniref:cbb3-type cytochrome c oxidase subunit I n=1 Tax=Parachryseolinea silvisoli TaxID=2873601 RepID=UPI002265BD97|nr:cbb3-type cytochrome c oxidase subunit I [Parachryseolinea silvisoli]MCD9016765.1 cbb3-type cytochrome c oxidase subunit I [Parachryseolinea silvisoli]
MRPARTLLTYILLLTIPALPLAGYAQPVAEQSAPLLAQPGILITLVLILIPLLAAFIFMIWQVRRTLLRLQWQKQPTTQADQLEYLEGEAINAARLQRKPTLVYQLSGRELAGANTPDDSRGIIQQASNEHVIPFVAEKKKAQSRPAVDPKLTRLILWYLGSATCWLVIGTTVGEYLGIKFVSPDADTVPWLSFGRLRPVHTNAVFWGWSTLAMLGLGYYVVPKVSNTAIASIRQGWQTLILVNAAVALGSLCLMNGINNAGGEYREYVWPVMALFGLGLIITLINFLRTVARRTTTEIYISNWYILSAIIFVLVITVIAYWPTWQNGLGETIVQGYYMHQGVGMWFMLFNLGLVYYFLPQQLNKPIYSYSLGILAFWAQILFYTLIGTHHFVFSSIPWWLQTVAIVGSMGMLIPVIAGTTNFFMTLKGGWNKIASSYTLPFYVTGIIFYFTGSLQGTAEAFRFTNLLWHFTDFTVAHSHLTMYGIIAFLLWASIYALVPRLTGHEPPQWLVGAHFWLAFLGMMFYTIPLMIGGTLRGLMWMEGKPFIESVVLMAPYWLWRAIGGSLMWLSHLLFAYNFYRMVVGVRAAHPAATPVREALA